MIYSNQGMKQFKNCTHLFFLAMAASMSGVSLLHAMQSNVIPVPQSLVQQPQSLVQQPQALLAQDEPRSQLMEAWTELKLKRGVEYRKKKSLDPTLVQLQNYLLTTPYVPENTRAQTQYSENQRRPVPSAAIEETNFRYICQISAKIEGDAPWCTSGGIVGPCHVVTTAHGIMDEGQAATEVVCTFGLDRQKSLSGPRKASRVFIPTRYSELTRLIYLCIELDKELEILCNRYGANEYSQEMLDNLRELKSYREERRKYDIAFIVLDKPIGLSFGRCGMVCARDEDLRNLPFTISGFPLDPGNCEQLFSSAATAVRVEQRQIFHNAQTSGAQSGSPLITMVNNRPYVLGVHVAGAQYPDLRSAVRLSENLFRDLVHLMEKTWEIIPEEDSNPFHKYHDQIEYSPGFIEMANEAWQDCLKYFGFSGNLDREEAQREGNGMIEAIDDISQETENSTKRLFAKLLEHSWSKLIEKQQSAYFNKQQIAYMVRQAVTAKIFGTWNKLNALPEEIGTIHKTDMPGRVIYLSSFAEDKDCESGLLAILNARWINALLRNNERISSDAIATYTEHDFDDLDESAKSIAILKSVSRRLDKEKDLSPRVVRKLAQTPEFGLSDVYTLQCNKKGKLDFSDNEVASNDLRLTVEQQNEFDVSSRKYKIRMRFLTKYLDPSSRGALYFICQLEETDRWILVALVKLRNQPPRLIVLDSENNEIENNYLEHGSTAYFIEEIAEYFIGGWHRRS